LKIVMLMVG
ncbi:hypothetical protein VCPCS022_003160B, partial [Vibrio cholerae O1 str. PCS-022]